MLNIYAGRENLDKERFIYDRISGEAIVLVPNQYTLVAEEQALKYTGRKCLFGIEILSMNRLGMRLLKEQGRESVSMLSRTGRTMLLSKLIRDHRDDLDFFRKSVGKSSFTDMISDFISEFKQQNCSLDEVIRMCERDDADPILRKKLGELEAILREYEQTLSGHFTDAEDYIAMYIDAIAESEYIQGKNIWIYGYDSITPKYMKAMMELAKRASDVNFILNRSDYGLDVILEERFHRMAADMGISVNAEEIGSEYEIEKKSSIKRIEKYLACDEVMADDTASPDGIEIYECSNIYNEAENAAAYVKTLIRDEGYRLKDIAIICNDKDRMQPIVQRIFAEYGLDIFVDSSRSITDCAPVCFVASLLALTRFPFSTGNIMALVKSGFGGVSREDADRLELYTRNHKLKGNMWTKPLKYGASEYGEEAFAELEATRDMISSKLQILEEIAKTSDTVKTWAARFMEHLENDWNFSEKLDAFVRMEESLGYMDEALRVKGSAIETFGVFDQLVQIMGDDAFDRDTACKMAEDGLTAVQVGIIPPALDGISMGTMIRTRPADVRAVLVLGANEGKLPMRPSTEGLFSVDEKNYFKENEFALGGLDEIKMTEENVAVYRILSKAKDRLYVSYSTADAENNVLVPSQIVDTLRDLFPGIEIKRDVVSEGFGMQLVSHRREALRHMISHIKDKNLKTMDTTTAALMDYFKEEDPERLGRLIDAACDTNAPENLGKGLSAKVFGSRDGSLRLSASQLQRYRECPFSYFVGRGLKPLEERVFESDARSIGDVYHECLMNVGRRIDEGDETPVETLVDEELGRISAVYREGVFGSSKLEEYRLSRIKEICTKAARAVKQQVESGTVKKMWFEEGFGRGRTFAPLELEIDGVKVRVEGKIDRADLLEGDKIRIIDYKTGSDKLDIEKVRAGSKMQLMIYLMSAASGEYEPAGLFYFNISEKEENASKLDEKKMAALDEKSEEEDFKLRGAWIDEPGNLELMPESVLKEKEAKGISRSDYDELAADVRERISETGAAIINGDIAISPLKGDDKKLVCRYCDYRAICRYDASSYAGNKARELEKRTKQKED